MIRGEHDTKCPSGWTPRVLVLGDEIKNAFHLDRHSVGELPVIYLWPGEALGIPAERGCQSLGTPSPMTSTNFLSLFTFFWLCFATIISRTMHFPCINYLICSKRPPVTDLDFKTGSLWSQVSDHRVLFTTLRLMWFSLFNAPFAYLYINLQNTEISPPRRNHIHTCTRSRPPNLWVPSMVSLSRASVTDSPHLDCCASVILHFTVEQQMRHFPWYSTIVSTVNQLLVEPHLSIWSRRPSRKDGASMQSSRRFCSRRIWEVNFRRSWWFCSSTADPRMWERMRLWTLLIWPRRGANWARVDSFWVKLSFTICTQSSFTILRTFFIFSLDIEIIFIFLQHRCMKAFLCSTHLKR